VSPPLAQVSARAAEVRGHLFLIGDQVDDLHPEVGKESRNGPNHCRAARANLPSATSSSASRLPLLIPSTSRRTSSLFRAAAAADRSGRALEDLVSSLAADGHEILGDVMKRVPRGYPASHPRAVLLRHRSLIAARDLESDAVSDIGPVYRACERLRPLPQWLAGHTAAAAPGPQAHRSPSSVQRQHP
jgi:hypothetical protein